MTRIKSRVRSWSLAATLLSCSAIGFPTIAQEAESGVAPQVETDGAAELKFAALEDRIKALEEPGSGVGNTDWVTPIVAITAALLGAGLGGVISVQGGRKAEKRALEAKRMQATISVCTEWIRLASVIASVNYSLESASSKIVDKNFNEIVFYGNWLEMVLLLRSDKLLDENFLEKFEFKNKVVDFKDKVGTAAKKDARLIAYESAWNNISSITKGVQNGGC